MKHINKDQLFSLMFIFEIGSTTLFALGIKAKQDAWIAILVATAIGMGFAWVYTELQNAFPGKNYVEIIISILGRWLGIPLSLFYAAFWLWPATRNLREFGELVKLTFLPNTPLTVIIFTFVISSLYVLSLGTQVFARTSEITMPLITFFIITLFIMISISGYIDLQNLRPVLGNGITPVLKAAYPSATVFPSGEALIFSMYWCYLDKKNAARSTTLLALALSGLLLSITLAIYITTLGPEYTSVVTIPFIEIVKMVSIGEFLTNLDAIGICVIFLGGFYKMSVFLNGITMILVTVFGVKKSKFILFSVGFFALFVSIVFEPSYTYHLWMFPFDANYFNTPFAHVIPVLLLLIYWIKNKPQNCSQIE